MKIRWLLSLTLAVMVASCAGEDQGPPPDTGGGWPDMGATWPDFSWPGFSDLYVPPVMDLYPPLTDAANGPQDGGVSPDSAPTGCVPPSAGSCSNCTAGAVCTGANGGTCLPKVELVGAADSTAVKVAVATAYANCWIQTADANLDADTLCATFDTCQLTGSLTEPMVCDWVCKGAQVSDFSSASIHDKAKQVCGCGLHIHRPDWKIGSLVPDQVGVICLSYDWNSTIFQKDYLHVNLCDKFPP